MIFDVKLHGAKMHIYITVLSFATMARRCTYSGGLD
jgi:hypothetical protein